MMKLRTLAAASAAFGLMAAASAANALTITTVAGDLFGTTLAAHNQVMLYDFDAIANPAVAWVGNEVTTTPDPITNSSPPPYTGPGAVIVTSNGNPAGPVSVDGTDYASVQGGGTSTFSMVGGNYLSSFSFYMGSPDAYNKLTVHYRGGGTQVLNGNAIWGGTPSNPNGDRVQGYRVYYDFGGQQVQSITFQSTQDAFEFDGLAGGVVPEPGTWALMIMGFGGAGAMIRRRKAALA